MHAFSSASISPSQTASGRRIVMAREYVSSRWVSSPSRRSVNVAGQSVNAGARMTRSYPNQHQILHDLGERIAELRRHAGLTQEQLSELSDIDVQAFSAPRRGAPRSPWSGWRASPPRSGSTCRTCSLSDQGLRSHPSGTPRRRNSSRRTEPYLMSVGAWQCRSSRCSRARRSRRNPCTGLAFLPFVAAVRRCGRCRWTSVGLDLDAGGRRGGGERAAPPRNGDSAEHEEQGDPQHPATDPG